VNASQITDQLFKSNLTFCVVCVFTQQTDKWCVHNRFFKANFDDKFKKVNTSHLYFKISPLFPLNVEKIRFT
jgi:hypothetical protein